MTSSDRRTLTRPELEQHLAEQLRFLEASAAAFDNGFDGEAKRLAVTLRVLLYDGGSSRSLLGQLGRKSELFWDTSFPIEQGNPLSYAGLVWVALGGPNAGPVPTLDDVPNPRQVPFDVWWSAPVIVNHAKRSLARKDLILIAANQDGGAHVDPGLDAAYAKLSSGDMLGWWQEKGGPAQPVERVERAAIRQIAHEVLKTLIPGYTKTRTYATRALVGNMRILGATPAATSGSAYAAGRNDPCPCGSGKKFKKCHGAS